MAHEYLPLCDVLFNIVSMASYFCDVVFDLVSVYSFYESGELLWFGMSMGFICSSVILTQTMSLVWYFRDANAKDKCDLTFISVIHGFCSGVLWRYCKLFIPVDMTHAKSEIRDLCTLRLLHGFCEAGPMLMIQLYYIWTHPVTDLNIVSTSLSLFCVCWALASYNKNMRRKNADAIVMTWMGVISQFLWRLGTVAARVTALTVYATLYSYWLFLVIGLHWISMLLWLLSQNIIFFSDATRTPRRYVVSMGVAVIYVFCFLNLQEGQSRHRMVAFYSIMLVENSLLMAVWVRMKSTWEWFHVPVLCIVWGCFVAGIIFMIMYYKYFHVSKLRVKYGSALSVGSHRSECGGCKLGSCTKHTNGLQRSSTAQYRHMTSGNRHGSLDSKLQHRANGHIPSLRRNHSYNSNIQGIFNCRFNPRIKRKKKKPSSFVPPPVPQGLGRMERPFWMPEKKHEFTSVTQTISPEKGICDTPIPNGIIGNGSIKLREHKTRKVEEAIDPNKRSSLVSDGGVSVQQKRLSHYSDHSNYTMHTHSSSCFPIHGNSFHGNYTGGYPGHLNHQNGGFQRSGFLNNSFQGNFPIGMPNLYANEKNYYNMYRAKSPSDVNNSIESMYINAMKRRPWSDDLSRPNNFPPCKPGTNEIILTPEVLQAYERQLSGECQNNVYGSVHSEQITSHPQRNRLNQKRFSYDGNNDISRKRTVSGGNVPRSKTVPKDITNQIMSARLRIPLRPDTFTGGESGVDSDTEMDRENISQPKLTTQRLNIRNLDLRDLGETQL